MYDIVVILAGLYFGFRLIGMAQDRLDNSKHKPAPKDP